MMTTEEARAYIARKQQQIDDLIERHGQGVRPDWLSEEISSLYFYKADAEKQLAAMESENDAND